MEAAVGQGRLSSAGLISGKDHTWSESCKCRALHTANAQSDALYVARQAEELTHEHDLL